MANQEKFKTTIGGQALIEGILMRGPEKDAVVIRGKDGLTLEVTDRKLHKPGSNLALSPGHLRIFRCPGGWRQGADAVRGSGSGGNAGGALQI